MPLARLLILCLGLGWTSNVFCSSGSDQELFNKINHQFSDLLETAAAQCDGCEMLPYVKSRIAYKSLYYPAAFDHGGEFLGVRRIESLVIRDYYGGNFNWGHDSLKTVATVDVPKKIFVPTIMTNDLRTLNRNELQSLGRELALYKRFIEHGVYTGIRAIWNDRKVNGEHDLTKFDFFPYKSFGLDSFNEIDEFILFQKDRTVSRLFLQTAPRTLFDAVIDSSGLIFAKDTQGRAIKNIVPYDGVGFCQLTWFNQVRHGENEIADFTLQLNVNNKQTKSKNQQLIVAVMNAIAAAATPGLARDACDNLVLEPSN